MSGAIAEPLSLRRRPNSDRADEVEEETVDETEEIADDGSGPADRVAVLIDDAQTERQLAKRPAEPRLTTDVGEREKRPDEEAPAA